MPRKPAPEPRASRSGSYVHESQRHTVPLKLRLRPEVAETIRRRAAAEEMTIAAYVEHLVTQDSR